MEDIDNIKKSMYTERETEINPNHKECIILPETELNQAFYKELDGVERLTGKINDYKRLRNQFLGLLISTINLHNTDLDVINTKEIDELVEAIKMINEYIIEIKMEIDSAISISTLSTVSPE